MATLEIRALSVGYGPVRALRDISVDVPDGAITAVLGGNGAGKTTLLRAVSRTLGFHRAVRAPAPSGSTAVPWRGCGPPRWWPQEWSRYRRAGRSSPG